MPATTDRLCAVIDGLVMGMRVAQIAADLDVGLDLLSAPDAAAHWGGGGFSALAARLRADHPALSIRAFLDCGTAAGHAAAILNQPGYTVDGLVFSGHPAAAAALEEQAVARGIALLRERPPGLWLRPGGDARKAALTWLAENR